MDITTKKEKPKNTETLEEKTTFVIGEPKPQTPVHTVQKIFKQLFFNLIFKYLNNFICRH